jgi:hypothetical protein
MARYLACFVGVLGLEGKMCVEMELIRCGSKWLFVFVWVFVEGVDII